MYAVNRYYAGAGAKELFELLASRKSDVEALIKGVNGVVSYTLVQLPEGGVSMTVCQDKAGCEESIAVAAKWIGENASHITASAPMVSEGEVIANI